MITVLFQTESHFPVNKEKIRQAIEEHLNGKVWRKTEVSVSIVGDRQMKHLNKTYRNIDATTDVLSFPLNEVTPDARPSKIFQGKSEMKTSDASFVDPPDKILRLGDIVVSYPQAIIYATEKNKLVDVVIAQLVIHGLNHLLGIHHAE